ncbi:MAG TPA: GNAT family N-acetyltransferase [Gemmatimonadaceae bacterium]|nr:GNAT family N-acetyltransferase [Gemmatimonadaceae bacterium]
MNVIDNSAERQFEIHDGERPATLSYSVHGGDLYLIHTEVPKPLEGRGYASALAQAALEHARREHMRVVPRCPFVRAYIRRHPEYSSLVDHEHRAAD